MSVVLTEPAPLPELDQLLAKISELQDKLRTNMPGYEGLLHTIHTALHKDEAMVHMLNEEQIGVIVAGLCKKKNVVIAESNKSKGKTTTGKSLKDITLSEL